jgi:aspartate/methionine/tyrosine aminotransferase
MRPAARMNAVQAPVIPIVGDLVRRYPGTISLGQGMVSYGPPPDALARAAAAAREPELHHYGAVEGDGPLIEALAAKLLAENDITGKDSRIVVTAGGNMAFMNALLAISDPGDEIILPVPYYFNHEMAIVMAGCRPVLVPTTESYQLRLEMIEAALTERTRAIVTVSPNNPTGAVYPERILRDLNAMCAGRGICHISDEVYEYFTYDAAQHFSSGSIEKAARHTISIYSLSKAYGFAGWRVGYMVVPEDLIEPIAKIQDTILICAPRISQAAALGALSAGSAWCRARVAELADVRDTVIHLLKPLEGICSAPRTEGAFYFLLKVHTDFGPMRIVERLIREFGVAVIPGNTFGLSKACYLRISYGALDKDTVAEGVGRLVRGLRTIVSEERPGGTMA